MSSLLNEDRFDFISGDDKAFIRAFDAEITRLGYDFGDKIGSGYCWGKYMLIYTKTGVKSKNVYARIYIRDFSIVLRLFLMTSTNTVNTLKTPRPLSRKSLLTSTVNANNVIMTRMGNAGFGNPTRLMVSRLTSATE